MRTLLRHTIRITACTNVGTVRTRTRSAVQAQYTPAPIGIPGYAQYATENGRPFRKPQQTVEHPTCDTLGKQILTITYQR